MNKSIKILTLCFAVAVAGVSGDRSPEKRETSSSETPTLTSVSSVSSPNLSADLSATSQQRPLVETSALQSFLDDPQTKFASLIGDVSDLHQSFSSSTIIDTPDIRKCMEIRFILRHNTIKDLWTGLETQGNLLVSRGVLEQKESDVIVLSNGIKLVDVKEKVLSLGLKCITTHPDVMLGKLIVS